MASTHRCRRSCPNRVPRNLAFCRACWDLIPRPVRKRILKSWDRVQACDGALDAYGDHANLLMQVEDVRPFRGLRKLSGENFAEIGVGGGLDTSTVPNPAPRSTPPQGR